MAGGYGFWCDAACARKKDQSKKDQQDQVNAALAELQKETGPNVAVLVVGGLVVSAIIIYVVLKLKKKTI